MKNLTDIKEYREWQSKFEREFGIRLLRDREYDSNRIKASFED